MLLYSLSIKIPPGSSKYLSHNDSTQGVPNWFTPVGLAIILYLGIRVYLALRKKKE